MYNLTLGQVARKSAARPQNARAISEDFPGVDYTARAYEEWKEEFAKRKEWAYPWMAGAARDLATMEATVDPNNPDEMDTLRRFRDLVAQMQSEFPDAF